MPSTRNSFIFFLFFKFFHLKSGPVSKTPLLQLHQAFKYIIFLCLAILKPVYQVLSTLAFVCIACILLLLVHPFSQRLLYRNLLRHITTYLSLSFLSKSRLLRLNLVLDFIFRRSTIYSFFFKLSQRKSVLFCGQGYYNSWYLSRQLRNHNWTADLYDWDENPKSQLYYHGSDIKFDPKDPSCTTQTLDFYIRSLFHYDIFHFANTQGLTFGWRLRSASTSLNEYDEIYLLRTLGKYIFYSNNGCQDGVSQTSFSQWGESPVCNLCIWKDNPSVCSDDINLAWGSIRNRLSDYQITSGCNRVDFNDTPEQHEVPQYYCLDPDIWSPTLSIPPHYQLTIPPHIVRLYHSVGNLDTRTNEDGINIKSSHIYLPLIRRLHSEGFPIQLLSPSNIPNLEIRFIQSQADIFLDMLSYGWPGATAREGLMLGKVVICYLRPEWLQYVSSVLPDYVSELPIVSATPDTVESTLKTLIADPSLRLRLGRQGRQFALKWHSSTKAAEHFDQLYTQFLLR